MKRMHKITLALLCFLPFGGLSAQTALDALRYMYLDYGGTARHAAVGGSLGSLGGDFAGILSNPASLAAYRRSEIMVTPGLQHTSTDAFFNNAEYADSKAQLNLNNVGLVIATQPFAGDWKALNIAIGYNRLANFNQRFNFTGTTQGSITDRWVALAQGYFPEELYSFEEGLAYDVDAIFQPNATNDPTFYENDFIAGDQISKAQTVNIRGSMNELTFGLAANFDHRLFLGVTMGIPFVSYEESKRYTEDDATNSIPNFNQLVFGEYLQTTGVGINLKLGLQYRASQALRLGAYIHTPTAFALSDNYRSDMSFNVSYPDGNTQTNSANSPEGQFSYGLNTPWRVGGNLGLIAGSNGFLSAEIEWVDYSLARYNFDEDIATPSDLAYENAVNNDITAGFASAMNLRVGGEVALQKYRLRGGYQYNSTPFASDEEGDNDRHVISAGLGLRESRFFIDFAALYTLEKDSYLPFIYEPTQPVVYNDVRNMLFLMTFGFKL